MKSKEELIQLNKEQKAFYNNEEAYVKPNFFSKLWRGFRNGPLNGFQKEYALRQRMYDLHKEWMGDLSDKKVLDLGCLRGNTLSLYMAENAKEYIGIDLSDVAIAGLNKKLASLNKPSAKAIAVDFLSDDFDAGDFDIIYAFGVLHHFQNFEVLLQRLVEKLKPGGEVISFDPLETSAPVQVLRQLYRPFQQDKDWEWPFNKNTFPQIEKFFVIKELRGVLGKTKYGLLVHLLPLSSAFKKRTIEKQIASDWRPQHYSEVLNCMQVTIRLRKR